MKASHIYYAFALCAIITYLCSEHPDRLAYMLVAVIFVVQAAAAKIIDHIKGVRK